jgi:UDP-3-O-[3-hydroxymyristoyl] glucosamine N-acyltransferase
MNKFSLKELIPEMLGLDIDCDVAFTGFVHDKKPGTLSYLENHKFLGTLNNNPNIVAALVRNSVLKELRSSLIPVVVEKPAAAFYTLHNEYCKRFLKYPASVISESAQIGPQAFIAPCGVTIGENVKIHSHAAILEGVEIEENSSIGPGCVVGSEGFQIYDDLGGVRRMLIHDGQVKIGQNVDIQPNCVISKGLMGRDTIIGDECKIDVGSHIGHGAKIGKRCTLVGGVGLGGGVQIGDEVWLGTQSVIATGVIVHDRARVLMGSVVIRDVKAGEEVSGNFAGLHEKNLLLTALRNR